MQTTQRRTSHFDARSVLLFAALALGGAALQAQTAPGASAKPGFGPSAQATQATPPKYTTGPAAAAPSAASAAFDRADANHDGKLSPQEAATLPAIGNRFEQLDTDKDGFLSHAEFDKGAKS